jgi:hypothetical protein
MTRHSSEQFFVIAIKVTSRRNPLWNVFIRRRSAGEQRETTETNCSTGKCKRFLAVGGNSMNAFGLNFDCAAGELLTRAFCENRSALQNSSKWLDRAILPKNLVRTRVKGCIVWNLIKIEHKELEMVRDSQKPHKNFNISSFQFTIS